MHKVYKKPKSSLIISLFTTDGGGKLLLTQVASPRNSIQDDGVLSLISEPCEYHTEKGTC